MYITKNKVYYKDYYQMKNMKLGDATMRIIKRNFYRGGVIVIFILQFVLLIAALYKSGYYKNVMSKLGMREVRDMDRPDYWCIKSWTRSLQKMNISCDVCFFGHSMIAQSNFHLDFPNKKIVELGYSGDNIKGMQARVAQIVAVHPKKVFIMAGTNSLSYTKAEFEKEYDRLITAIHNSLPCASLYLFNIIPQNEGSLGNIERNQTIKERNLFIRKYSQNKGIPMIDVYSLYVDSSGGLDRKYTKDGVHLVPKAYVLWANAIKPFVENQ